jgi:hypothetical protein
MSEPAEKLPRRMTREDIAPGTMVTESERDPVTGKLKVTRRPMTDEERQLLEEVIDDPRPALSTEEFIARVGHHIGRR